MRAGGRRRVASVPPSSYALRQHRIAVHHGECEDPARPKNRTDLDDLQYGRACLLIRGLPKSAAGRELKIKSLFCKPICKPDAARQHETGETEPTERDGICPVRRGHHARERRLGTAETHVVWLAW